MATAEPTFAVFASMVLNAVTNSRLAYEAAKNLEFFKCEARDIARQRRMNQMVENQIINIEEMFNIVVACDRSEARNHVPFPPVIRADLTVRNYRNGVGRVGNSRPADWEDANEADFCS